MTRQRLYHDLASIWPLVSPPEDYAAEARCVWRILEAQGVSADNGERPSLLELGAGGGHTLWHLNQAYDTTAVDASEQMLANCRTLNPDTATVVGDMRDVRLERVFDAVLIHDAIDYMTSERDLRAALDTAAAHLRPGGVLLVAPTYVRETFTAHQAEHDQRADDTRTVTYLSYVHDPDPSDTTFELILSCIIHEHEVAGIEHDRHTCGLFDHATWDRTLRDAGFGVTMHEPADDEPDWLLFVGIMH